jgi:hypothetical protein
MRWAWCSDTKDIGELELEGDRNGSGLLGLNSGNVHLEGDEGSDQVDWRGDSSQGGAMATCSYCNMALVATTHSREVTTAAWTLVMVMVKLAGATSVAIEAMAIVSRSKVGGVAMTKVGSGWNRAWIWASVWCSWDGSSWCSWPGMR